MSFFLGLPFLISRDATIHHERFIMGLNLRGEYKGFQLTGNGDDLWLAPKCEAPSSITQTNDIHANGNYYMRRVSKKATTPFVSIARSY